mgnify:CR=1 FL=1
MSDLVDRYLGAVAALLPKASREDIVAELRDLIMNRVEEREAALGRPLDKRETEELLREIGHPIAVAGRYGPRTALIGPELYPFWLFGVKALLAIAALATIIPAGIVLITGHGGGHVISGAVNDFIGTGLSLVGFATLVGAAIERGWIKLGDFGDWKVSDLPRVPEGKGWFVKSRFDGLFELVATGLFIAWWTGVAPFPTGRTHGDGGVAIGFSPIFQALHWPILALAVIQVASSLILVIKPGGIRARAAAEMVCSLGGLALIGALWPAQPLVTFTALGAVGESVDKLQRTVDLTLQMVLVVAAAICLGKLLVEGRRLLRGR